jgi:hypothetical protein
LRNAIPRVFSASAGVSLANENSPSPAMRHPVQSPVRWRLGRVLVAVAPTLATITLLAGYYLGGD